MTRVLLVALAAVACGARPAPTLRRVDAAEGSSSRAHAQRSRAVAGSVAPPRSLAAVRRLRGGDEGGPVAGLQRAFLSVPVVTRSWFSVVLGLAALAQAGIVSEEPVAVDAAAFSRFQIWRPFTAAAFLGGVGPQLLQKLYYGISFGKELERELGSAEFLRAAASSIAALTLVCHFLGWPHSADGLIMAVTLLACLQNPTRSVSMYGLNIPYQYLPLAQLAMSYLFTQAIPWVDIAGLFVGYSHYLWNDNLKPDAVLPNEAKVRSTCIYSSATYIYPSSHRSFYRSISLYRFISIYMYIYNIDLDVDI